MARTVVPEAEQILDQEVPVLDKGFVRLVDYMGGDERIVQSARVSYGSGTKSFRQDRGLIHYLLRNDHTSPFEQVTLTFHCKMPIFVARQWVRHRTASLNEISGRYSIMKEEFYLPPADQMRMQSQDNKQGRADETLPREEADRLIQEMGADQHALYEHYEQMIERGLAREIARANLPLALYTEWYWQIDLHNLFRFLRLRMDAHAQYEIRCYAEAMAVCARAVAPLAYEAFEEHVLNSVRLGREECMALNRLLRGEEAGLEGRAQQIFEAKLAQMAKMEPIAPVEEPELPG
jgi:thymidylate synthase (FAD)